MPRMPNSWLYLLIPALVAAAVVLVFGDGLWSFVALFVAMAVTVASLNIITRHREE
jgi:uncharacterized membrane protein YjjP (DUF1212 family)